MPLVTMNVQMRDFMWWSNKEPIKRIDCNVLTVQHFLYFEAPSRLNYNVDLLCFVFFCSGWNVAMCCRNRCVLGHLHKVQE